MRTSETLVVRTELSYDEYTIKLREIEEENYQAIQIMKRGHEKELKQKEEITQH